MVCFEDRMDGIIKIEQAILDEYRKAYQKKQSLDKEKIDLFVTLEKEWISTFQSPKTILEVLRKINVDNHEGEALGKNTPGVDNRLEVPRHESYVLPHTEHYEIWETQINVLPCPALALLSGVKR